MSGLNWISYNSTGKSLNAETVSTPQLYSNAISFFKTPPALNSSGTVTTLQKIGNDIPPFASATTAAVVFSGYFVPDRTGNWTFDTSVWTIDPTIDTSFNSIFPDDFGILFIGTEDNSLNIIVPNASYTNVSSSISNTIPIIYSTSNRYTNVSTPKNTVYLNRGKPYPILYYWNQSVYSYSVGLKFKYANDTNYITNFNGYIYKDYASSPIYYTGTTPSITKIATGNANTLRIFYNSALGCPAPTYYYSVDVSSNRQLIGSYNSPIDISGLSNGPHTIYIIAENTDPSYNYWITYDSSSGTPYTTANVPSNQFQYLKFVFLKKYASSDAGIQFSNWNFYDISANRIDYSRETATWVPVSAIFGNTQHPLPEFGAAINVGATVDGGVNSSGFLLTTLTKNYLLINFGIVTNAYKYNYLNGDSYHNRDPVSWDLYSSIDGINYSIIDRVRNASVNLSNSSLSKDFIIHYNDIIPQSITTIPETPTVRSFRYLRFIFDSIRGSGNTLQFSDIKVRYLLDRVDFSSATALWTGSGISYSGVGAAFAGIDGSNNNKTGSEAIISISSSGLTYTIDFGKNISATNYSYVTANDVDSRDPVSWKLYASDNNVNYSLIDYQINATITTSRNTETQSFNMFYNSGTAPSITSITPGINSVIVNYTPSTGGNPTEIYYYSVDSTSDSNLVLIGSYFSPIAITGITAGTHTIYITARGFDSSLNTNTIWTTVGSASTYAYSTPSITRIDVGINAARVYFNSASSAASTTYYYSIDGSLNPVRIGSYVSSIDISGLSANQHSIYIFANGLDASSNVIWNTYDVSFATPLPTSAPRVSFQFLRYDFSEIRGNDSSIQFADMNVNFYLNRVDYSSAVASWTGGTLFNLTDQTPMQGIDGNITTKTGLGHGQSANYQNLSGVSYLINFGKLVTASTYSYTTGNDLPNRDPISWKLYASTDGVNFVLIDSRKSVSVTTNRNSESPTFAMNSPIVSVPSIISLTPISFSQIQVAFSPSTVGNPTPTYYYSIDGSSTLVSIGTSAVPFVVDNLSTGTHSISITARGFDSSSNLIWSTISTSTGSTYKVGTQPTINAVTQLPNNRMGVSFNNSFGGVPTPTYYYSLDGSSTLVNITNNSNFFVIDSVSGINHTISITAKGLDPSSNEIWSTTSATVAESAYIPTRLYNDGTMWTAFITDPSYNLASSSDGITWKSSFSSTANNAMLNLPTLDPSLNIYPGFNYPINSVPSSIVPIATKYVHNNSDRGCAKIQPLTIACGQGNTTMAYSVDGIQWVSINNSLFTSSNKAVWNGLKWVAVGTGAYWVATSYDGLSWTGQNSTLMTECYDIAWNGTYFVAVGYNSSVASLATSVDGITWTSVTISSIFSTYIHAIEWTGSVWLAYGSGTNTTAVSSSINASIWTATSTQNLCVVDCSNLVFGNISATTASSTNGGFSPANAFDGSFNTVITKWQSASSNYNTSGAYTGTTTTPYNPSSSTSGEWLQVQLTNPVVCKHYYIVFSIDDASAIPKSWHLLGSNDGTSWDPLDKFYGTTTPPNNNWKYPFVCLPLSIQSNTTAYSYYRIIFQTSFGNSYVSVSEFVLFGGGSQQLDRYIRPIVLKDIILHPTRILSVDGVVPNVYRITDLSCNLIQTGIVHGDKYVNNTLYGLAAEPAATAFDGLNHLVFSTSGEIAYLSNTASNTNLNFDNSFNGVVIAGSTTAINAACYNRKFILFGDASGSIRYGILNANTPPTFYSTNASSLFSTIYGLASNSGYGFVVSPNTIYLKEDEKLSIVTPKFYDSALSSDTSISFNVYNASN